MTENNEGLLYPLSYSQALYQLSEVMGPVVDLDQNDGSVGFHRTKGANVGDGLLLVDIFDVAQ